MENKETRTEKVMVRFTPSELKALKEQAEAQDRKVSNLIHAKSVADLNNK